VKATMLLIVVLAMVSSSGCAGMMQTINSDPVRYMNIDSKKKDVVAMVSLAADRRNVVVGLQDPNRGKFCAEPPPDVAKEIVSKALASLAASAAKKGTANVTLSSEYRDAAVILTQRSEALEIFRTGAYALCQYHLNGALSGDELMIAFESFVSKVLAKTNLPAVPQGTPKDKDVAEGPTPAPSGE
jgi:hypothetical protein